MDQDRDVYLRWDHHQTTLLTVFSSLLKNENLVDCTISAEGQHFKAHRVILSACSPYFESLFSEHCEIHPVVILPDVKFEILKALLEFMYSGEVKVPQDRLSVVLKLAETLQIKGLSSVGDSELKDNSRPKRRNKSSIFCDHPSFKKHMSEHRSGFEVKQREDVSSLHTSENVHSEDNDPSPQAVQMCMKTNSNSVTSKRAVKEAANFQEISDNDALNVLQCSSVTKTLIKSEAHLSGTLLNSDTSILDPSQLSVSHIVKAGDQRLSSENVISTLLSSEELRTSASLCLSDERPSADLQPQMKQEDPDDFNSSSIEEIILDDDTDENDDHYCISDDENSSNVGGRVIPEDSFSGEGVCDVEQYKDTYIAEPASLLLNQFKCNVCGRSYRYRKSLERHMRYECGKEPQFSCCFCPGRFFHKYKLKAHIARIHSAH